MYLTELSKKIEPEVIRPSAVWGRVCGRGGGPPEIRRPALREKRRGSEVT